MSRKLTIEDMQKIAEEHGGKCVSDIYVNNRTKLIWECGKCHHCWEARAGDVKNKDSWCPLCAYKQRAESQKLGIQEIQKIAEEFGGKCLSNTYINANTKLVWQCADGHQWESTPANIKQGYWCPYCAGNVKDTIENMRKIAENRGGKCLSDSYVNSLTKLLWECENGHQWKATPVGINQGYWCPHCAKVAKKTIEEIRKIAEERGGKCLSNVYKDNKTKLLWQCSEGHTWKTTANVILRGCWCPKCSSGLGERICREFFEQLFGKKFSKNSPKWLINHKGNRMELDGYCESLRLAFEHHGEQHYSTKNQFIKTEEALKERQKADQIKKTLCTQRKITLIEIPEVPSRLCIEDVRVFIKSQCLQYGILLPADFDTRHVDLKKAYATSGAREMLNELHNIAKKHNGKCLSDIYINNNTKLLWECNKGHQWKATPHEIKSGYWCSFCSGTAKLKLEDMQRMAEERKGKCLSSSYTNSRTKLLWECAYGHQWKTTPHEIQRGYWCPFCSGNAKGTIEQMQKIAENKGGKCLSIAYMGKDTKLEWGCKQGHRWEARPHDIKCGHWCPYCAGLAKGTIEEMRNIASKRGGKCLSNMYINSRTKLKWECAQGHQWEARPDSIKNNNNWCPMCAKL